MGFSEWWDKLFGVPESAPIPAFDVMTIPLDGEYVAKIEEAEVYTYKAFPGHGVRLKCRLVPDDPEDYQTAYTMLSKRQYVELLRDLEIKRTNDVTVLEGHHIPVKVETIPAPFRGGVATRTSLIHMVEEPKPKPKRRTTRARTPTKMSK